MKKTVVLLFAAVMLFGIQSLRAESKTEKIKVSGNCGMCETRIEKAALAVAGVTKADWDAKSKDLTVVFDASKASVDKIEVAVAKVGHDTPLHKADSKTYEALPGCCHYDRPAAK